MRLTCRVTGPRLIAAVVTMLAATSCGGADGTAAVPLAQVASVVVSPSTQSLYVGQTMTLTVALKDATGGVLTSRAVTWSSSDASVASVAGGVVSALKPGAATLAATSEGKSGIAQVTVSLVPVASVGVTPAQNNVYVGQTIPLAAQPKDSTGTSLAGRAVVWSSSGIAVATVSTTGQVTGVAPGVVSITATSETRSGTAAAIVLAVGPRLIVSVDGVPGGVPTVPLQVKSADLIVLFNTAVSVTTPLALTTLSPGQYTLTAGQAVATVNGVAFVYLPPNAQQVQTVSVGQFATTSVLLNYTLRTGAISITASGLPAGTQTACVLSFPPPGVQGIIGAGVQTPSGQTATVQAYGTGVGTLTCNPVTVANVLYQATPFQQSVTIPASMTPATATVVYH